MYRTLKTKQKQTNKKQITKQNNIETAFGQ